MGVALGIVTVYVLFEDVFTGGAKITTDHILTLAVLGIIALAGHLWLPQFQVGAYFTGIGLISVLLLGSAYIVVASGGRNAEVAISKRAAVKAHNEAVDRTKALLDAADAALQKDKAAFQKESRSGCSTKCQGAKTSKADSEADVAKLTKELADLGPKQEESSVTKAAARVGIAWQGLEGDAAAKFEADTVARLELLLPYGKALLVEFATLVFLSVGIGHRHATVAAPSPGPGETVATDDAKPLERLTTTVARKPKVAAQTLPEQLCLELLQEGAKPQAEIVQLFGGCKSKASRALARLEDAGLVKREEQGRQKMVALAHRRSA